MNHILSKFYSKKNHAIHEFLDSEMDILYVSGFSGSGKSSILKSAIKNYDKDIVLFHHICFKNTVTDDFLLSFYDSFREYSLSKKIILKKNPEESFLQKVSFYFNNLEAKSVVIVDNFEKISDDSEIVDFLLHISSFENVKLIIVSKNPTCRLIENPTVGVETLFFDKINQEEFFEILTSKFPDADNNLIQKLFEITNGYELYLKMILNYLDSISVTLSNFLEDFELKKISFEEYIIDKQISLIPNTYYPVLENLAFIYHNISSEFLTSYAIADTKQINYLSSKFMVSEFFGTYYIKSYLRKYFAENTPVQSKITIINKLISIYENELKKSPKDRIVRLSRESIRNYISLLQEKLPKVQQITSAPAFNYVAHAISANPQWFVTGINPKNMKGMNSKKKSPIVVPNIKKEQKKVSKEPTLFEKMFEQATVLEEEYRYKEALSVFVEAKNVAKNLADKISAYSKIAINATKLNDNNFALNALREICEICTEENDINNFCKFRIEIGKIYKKMYAFARAKASFDEVIKKGDLVSLDIISSARFALGEICELENNFELASSHYALSIDGYLKSNGNYSDKISEVSFRLASLLDENGYQEEALNEYKNSIKYAEEANFDLHLSKAYLSCGIILNDLGKSKDAIEYLEYAYDLSLNNADYLDTCYVLRNLADAYKGFDDEKAYDCILNSLEYARLAENNFEIATSLLELGDYYYAIKQNEQALICYFQAKNYLGVQATRENLDRVEIRINDMKIKLGDYIFKGMEQLYDSN